MSIRCLCCLTLKTLMRKWCFVFPAFAFGYQPALARQNQAIQVLEPPGSYTASNEMIMNYRHLADAVFFEKIFQPALNADLSREEKGAVSRSPEFVDHYIKEASRIFDAEYYKFHTRARVKKPLKKIHFYLGLSFLLCCPALSYFLFPPPAVLRGDLTAGLRKEVRRSSLNESLEQYYRDSSSLAVASIGCFAIGGAISFLIGLATLGQEFKTITSYLFSEYVDVSWFGKVSFNTPVLPLMRRYAARRGMLPKPLQKQIDGMFMSYWLQPSDSAFDGLEAFLGIALRLPLKEAALKFDGNRAGELFRHYGPELRKNLVGFVFEAAMHQQKVAGASGQDGRYPLYLVGEPGTGKTHSVQLLSKALGDLPVARVNLDGASISDILGRSFYDQGGNPGRILEALIANSSVSGAGIKNQILFLDEFDQLLMPFLKSGDHASGGILSLLLKILDPGERTFYSPYLSMYVQLPDIIVLAGNLDLGDVKANYLKALHSRLVVLKFEGFSLEAKRSIVWEYLIPGMLKEFADNRNPGFRLQEVDNQDRKIINEFMDHDSDPGIRSVDKFIQKLLSRRAQQQLENWYAEGDGSWIRRGHF